MERATDPQVKLSTRIPTQEQRIAARTAQIAMSRRRQRPGSGSVLAELLLHRGTTMEWWRVTAEMLSRGGVASAAAGAIAANAYMPPRQTRDLDLMIGLETLPDAAALLTEAGWHTVGQLELYEGLKGTGWVDGVDHTRVLGVIGLPGTWGREAIASAQTNIIGRIPTLTLPFLVLTKLISARLQDTGDIARALGAAGETARSEVREVIGRYRPDDLADVEQLIELGKLEFGG